MKHLNTERLRHQLHAAVDDVEQVLQHMSDLPGDGLAEIESQAGRQLRRARNRLAGMQRRTATQLRRATRDAQGYVREHPWQVAGVVGGLGAVILAAALISRARH